MYGVTEELVVTEQQNGDETSNPNSWVAVTTDRDYSWVIIAITVILAMCRDTIIAMEQSKEGGKYLTHTVRQIYSIQSMGFKKTEYFPTF